LFKYYNEDLAREFEMKDMGLMHYFLGMEVWKGGWVTICLSWKLYQLNTEEVPHGEKQTHGDSSSRELEEGICYFR